MKVYGNLPDYKTLHLACPTRNEVIRLRSVDLGTMPNKINHKSFEELSQSVHRWTRVGTCDTLIQGGLVTQRNVYLSSKVTYKFALLSVWYILEMLYFAYCMNKYAKSEEESLTKICVSFVEINTDTECTGGRVGLMHQIANLAYMRIHVTWGRSPSCTLLLRYRNGYNGVVLKTIVS